MKKKKAKAKKQKIKKENVLSFPKQLQLEQYFASPIWWADEPSFVNKLNKASDSYIEAAKKTLKQSIDERNKKFGDKVTVTDNFLILPCDGSLGCCL